MTASIETTPEPPQATRKRGRDRLKVKPDSDDESTGEEVTSPKKRGRKSNGTTRKASPPPASSSDSDSPIVELLEPSAMKKWGNLPSWERHVEVIDTVEKTEEGRLFVYFKLCVFRLPTCTLSDSQGMLFVGRVRRQHAKKTRMSVGTSSYKRCAPSWPFNFDDLSMFRILALKILRVSSQVEGIRCRAGVGLKSFSRGLSNVWFPPPPFLPARGYFLFLSCKCIPLVLFSLSCVLGCCCYWPSKLLFTFTSLWSVALFIIRVSNRRPHRIEGVPFAATC